MVMGLSTEVIRALDGPLDRIWSAQCDGRTDFSSLASVGPGIGFARVGGGSWAVHLRGPATRATTMTCSPDSEYFGVDFRLGAYLPAFPPVRLADLRDAVLPTLPDGRILLDGQSWEMPTPQNLDVFVHRLERAGLLVVDPLIEELRHGDTPRAMPERTAQSRFVRAVGLSCRKLKVIERARWAASLLSSGAAIQEVVTVAGYYDQPQLTRSLRVFIGHTPAEIVRGDVVLGL